MADPLLVLEGLTKRFGATVPADGIDLAIGRGEFFTLLGPSGSGKSTVLRIIAGLEVADAGRVLIDGEDMTGVPPWRRHLGMVFQHYANFPHLDVAGNVAYGLRRSSLSHTEIEARVKELLALVQLPEFERRRPTSLSGGEQQRVAIARALAPRPRLLLLDEPLSALDEKIRRGMQEELRAIQRTTGTTFIYVTHDQEEALTMSDRIAVLHAGNVVQCEAPETIFRRPRTRFVAEFFRGSNVVEVVLRRQGDHVEVELAGVSLGRLPSSSEAVGQRSAALRGERIRLLAPGEPGDGASLPASLEAVTYRGLYSDYSLRLDDGQRLAAAGPHRHDVLPDERVALSIHAEDVVLLDTA